MDNFFDLYDLLIDGIDTAETVTRTFMGQCWTAVETEKSFGMAMTTPVDTAPRMYGKDFIGMPLAELAKAAKSWNLGKPASVWPLSTLTTIHRSVWKHWVLMSLSRTTVPTVLTCRASISVWWGI